MFWFDVEIKPAVMRSRLVKDIVTRMIAEGGHSTHSALGLTMKAILAGLETEKCPYRIKANPGVGYIIVVPPQYERG